MENIILDSDFIDIGFGFAFRFLNTNSMITKMHSHNFYEYFLVASGAVIHVINGEENILTAGDLVFIRPKDFHTYRFLPDVDCNIINVSFKSMYFDSLFGFLGEKPKGKLLEPSMPPKINISVLKAESNDEQSLFAYILNEHEILNFI